MRNIHESKSAIQAQKEESVQFRNTVKGMTNMSTRQLRNFAYECVDHYATYNRLDDFYSLDVSDLPDFVQHKFAAMLMAEDESHAAEATGPDNKHWDSKMLPALMRYLKNSTDKDEAIEFNNVWRDCVTDYMKSNMQELIDNSIADFNSDHGFTKTSSQSYGVHAHGPI